MSTIVMRFKIGEAQLAVVFSRSIDPGQFFTIRRLFFNIQTVGELIGSVSHLSRSLAVGVDVIGPAGQALASFSPSGVRRRRPSSGVSPNDNVRFLEEIMPLRSWSKPRFGKGRPSKS